VGELPSAAFNLACVDVREGKHDAAFQHLEKAVAAGFDEDDNLLKDADLAPIRDKAKFASILSTAKKNRATGDAAVVTEGTFVGPGRTPAAILVVLHDVSSDPFTAAGPFTSEAKARGLFLAVPRGPARAGRRRFGWGNPDRAISAVEAAVDAARKKAGNASLPILLVGVGRGGTIALAEGARKPGEFAGVASIGGPFDSGLAKGGTGLSGARLFLGIPRDAPPNLISAFRNGRDMLGRAGAHPAYTEWPGAGTAFPKNVPQAVKEALDSLTGTGQENG
jgi:pimeloyl-ACP methyl ester carboxylesterase